MTLTQHEASLRCYDDVSKYCWPIIPDEGDTYKNYTLGIKVKCRDDMSIGTPTILVNIKYDDEYSILLTVFLHLCVPAQFIWRG